MREKSEMVKRVVPAIPGKWTLVEVLGMKVRLGRAGLANYGTKGGVRPGAGKS